MKKWLRVFGASVCIFALNASCMKKPDLDNEDGPSVTAESVEDALMGAWGNNVDYRSIKVNDFVYTEKQITISELAPQVMVKDGKTVSAVETSSGKTTYKIIQQIAEVDSNHEEKLSTREIQFPKRYEPATDSAIPTSEDLMIQAMSMCFIGDEDTKVSCHNLRTWDEVEKAPPLLQKQPQCGGLAGCQLHKKVVGFDWIVEFTDTETQTRMRVKQVYTIKVSPDAPHLARVTDFCYEGLASSGGQKFPAKFCYTMQNFLRGN